MRFSTPRTTREPVSICRRASSRMPSSSAAAPGSSADLVFSLRSCRWDFSTASLKRSSSAGSLSSSTVYSGMSTEPASITWAGPMAMPKETPRPSMMRSRRLRLLPLRFFSLFIEAALHQRDQGGERLGPGSALGADLDFGAWAGGQHHQPHDRHAGHRHVALLYGYLDTVKAAGQLYELRRGARMQPALVADGHPARERF